MTQREFRQRLTNRTIPQEVMEWLLSEVPEPTEKDELWLKICRESEDSTFIETPGDIEELDSMTTSELIAFVQLGQAMNFIWFQSNSILGKHLTTPYWVGEPEQWEEVCSYWVEKFPLSWQLLRVWVWG